MNTLPLLQNDRHEITPVLISPIGTYLKHRRDKREAGVSMLELAICIPWLALVVFGTLSFGMTLRELRAISDAAKSGARLGAQYAANRDPAAPLFNCTDPDGAINTTIAQPECINAAFKSKYFSCDNPGPAPVGQAVSIYGIWATCEHLRTNNLSPQSFDVCAETPLLDNSLPGENPMPALKILLRRREGDDNCLVCWGNYFASLRARAESLFMLEGTGCSR